MSYATIQDLQKAFSDEEVLRLSDRDGSGELDEDRVNRAIEEACRLMDESLSARYDLVLVASANSERLRDVATDIARYRLYDNEHLPDDHPVLIRYREHFNWLKDIRKGNITIPELEDAVLDSPKHSAPVAPGRKQIFGSNFDSRYQEKLS